MLRCVHETLAAHCCRMIAAGLMEVIIYSSPDDKKKNRGFCFLEYESHKAASLAKRRLGTGRIKVRIATAIRNKTRA